MTASPTASPARRTNPHSRRTRRSIVPAYGGFCAFGVSVGKKFDGDPNLWKIEDGKLYLNLNEEIYATFLKDLDSNIEKAEKNWTKIEHTAATAL